MIDLREHGGVLAGARGSNMMVGEDKEILTLYPSYYYSVPYRISFDWHVTSNKGILMKTLKTTYARGGTPNLNDLGYVYIALYSTFDTTISRYRVFANFTKYNKDGVLVTAYNKIDSTYGVVVKSDSGYYDFDTEDRKFTLFGDGYVYSCYNASFGNKNEMSSYTERGVLVKRFSEILFIDRVNFMNNTVVCTMLNGRKNTYNLDFTPVSNDFIAKQKSLSEKNEAEYLFNKQLFDAPRG